MAAMKPRRTPTPRTSIPLNFELDRRARKLLVQARVAANLTQQELASRLGRAQSFVSRIEHGRFGIERAHFAAIARALGEDPPALFAKALEGPIERVTRRASASKLHATSVGPPA